MVDSLTDDALEAKLGNILETWPLYRELRYTGAESVANLPQLIRLHCPLCINTQWWDRQTVFLYSAGLQHHPTSDKSGFCCGKYGCRNCKGRIINFFYFWGYDKGESLFFKVGQHPPLEERLSPELERQLKGENMDFYRKALRSRNFNYGLGALAYLRRVIENQMNDLLDMIAQAAREANVAAPALQRLEEVKASRRFDDKVTYAAGILPPYLRPGGRNPIDLLHDIASEGIHAKPDEECIEIFDKSRLALEYVLKNLEVGAAEARAFVKELHELDRRKEKSRQSARGTPKN
jgi:hypothetical protein